MAEENRSRSRSKPSDSGNYYDKKSKNLKLVIKYRFFFCIGNMLLSLFDSIVMDITPTRDKGLYCTLPSTGEFEKSQHKRINSYDRFS